MKKWRHSTLNDGSEFVDFEDKVIEDKVIGEANRGLLY